MAISRVVLTALVSAGLAGTTLAATVDVNFFNITNNGNQGIAPQLKLAVSDVAGDPTSVDFVFRNLVGIASSIKEVYFDAGAAGSIFTSGLIQAQSGASFQWGSASPQELPGANNISPAFQTTLSLLTDSGNGGPSTGLDVATDSLTVRLSLASGKSYADIVAGLLTIPAGQAGSVRVGMHITSIGTVGGSDSYVSGGGGNAESVPLPPAAWAGLSSLAGLFGASVIRRRRNLATH